ncbi:MAG: sulfolactate dehydrogenase [Yangia sp.]|mgnify:CR=1 FL=1|nr:sulfolactate dehydrogenase [Salipiger sp.]
MAEKRLAPDEAEALLTRILMRCRTSETNARAVARALVAAELAGQAGHGFRRMPSYTGQALAGKVDGFATPVAEQIRPGALAIDAMHGFAYPAVDLALDWLPGAARAQGIAMAGIRRSNHCGVAGVIVERLAEAGMVALLFANAPASIAPWGGKVPLYGTDPIAFAAPLPGAAPVVVDIALSKVARGKILAATQTGAPIPEGWAFDPEGNPTTDAHKGLAGTMVPMGDAKGTALALMVELLCAGLTGGRFGYEATSFFDDKGGPPETGQLIIAIDPGAFGPGALERFAAMAAMIEGMDGARLPGRRRQQTASDLAEAGIPIDSAFLAEIEALGA